MGPFIQELFFVSLKLITAGKQVNKVSRGHHPTLSTSHRPTIKKKNMPNCSVL